MSRPSSFGFISSLVILATTIAQVAGVQAVTSVARLGSISWSYVATGIYPPSYNLSAHVNLQVRIGSSANSDTITGTGLWEITIYGNRETDGSGNERYDERTGFIADDQRAQSFSPTDSLEFHQGTPLAFDLSGLGCGTSGPFFCVEVGRAAGASVEFALEPDKWVSCKSTPCYFPDESVDSGLNVTFSDLQLNLVDAPYVPQDEPADLLMVITAVPAADSRRYVEGTGLWKVSVFGSNSSDGSGANRYDERPQVLTTAENTDKSLQAAQPMEMTVRTQFLLGGVGCDDYPYFCVTMDKGDDPQPDFGIVGPITHCQELECLFPNDTSIPTARFTEMNLRLELPSSYPYDEPADINLNVALTPSQSPQVPTSVIEGTDLWRLAFYGNKNSDGSGQERFDERPQVLSDTEQDAFLSPSDGLIFNVTTQFKIGRVGCNDLPYLCVEFGKGYAPAPDFVFDIPLIVCLEVPCITLPVAKLGTLSFNITNVGTGLYMEPVPISLDVQVGASQSATTTDLIRGSRLWQLSVYGSGQFDGSGGDRFDQRSVLSKCQADKSLLPGEPLQFEVDTRFIISGVGCYDYPYFCLKFEKGAGPEPDFIMLDPPVVCEELTCTPPPVPQLIIRGLSLQVKSGSPTAVQAGQDGSVNYLKFVLEVIYDKRQAGDISGSRLWVLALWGSANADGSGPKVTERPNVLRTLQTRLAVTLGEDFIWTSVRDNFDLTGATCADIGYICVKLSRGTAPADVFEFLTEPETYVPQTCLQMGCS